MPRGYSKVKHPEMYATAGNKPSRKKRRRGRALVSGTSVRREKELSSLRYEIQRIRTCFEFFTSQTEAQLTRLDELAQGMK